MDLFFPCRALELVRRNYLNLVIRTNGADEPRERATAMPPKYRKHPTLLLASATPCFPSGRSFAVFSTGQRLSRERRFTHLQMFRFQQAGIRRHQISGIEASAARDPVLCFLTDAVRSGTSATSSAARVKA